jgi:hypothetical protein
MSKLAPAYTTQSLRSALFDAQGNPAPALLDLLAFLHVQHDGTLDSIVAATQKEWLRQAGKERWQVEEKYPELRNQLMPYFEKVITLQEIKPLHDHYDYGIVLGAMVSRVRMRFAYLIDLWRAGVRVDKIVFFTGQRKLDPEQESSQILLDANNGFLPFKKDWHLTTPLPTIEIEMAKLVYEQADIPADMQKIPVQFADAPSQIMPDGTIRRPNRIDTINAWLAANPTPGSCLCISTQPHIGYEDAALRTSMPATFSIETVGPAARPTVRNVEILDALTRWLYQEQQMRNLKK